MGEPSSDRWSKFSFANPLVWLGALILFLLFLKAVLPQHYIENLPAMLDAGSRCHEARKVIYSARDAAEVCRYGIRGADPDSQIFVAEVDFQHLAYQHPERDAEAMKLFRLAEDQLLYRAGKGDKDAQAMLGKLYSHSVMQKGAEAAKWFCAAAKQGSSEGFTQLAILQGRQMFKTLYEGPDAYDAAAQEKYNVQSCKPATLDPPRMEARAADTLCPYKRETSKDGCNYRYKM